MCRTGKNERSRPSHPADTQIAYLQTRFSRTSIVLSVSFLANMIFSLPLPLCTSHMQARVFECVRGSHCRLGTAHLTGKIFTLLLPLALPTSYTQTAVFGEGTYLSSDLAVCMMFVKPSRAWAKSALGAKLSCVCVCEVSLHPGMGLFIR